MEWYLRVNLLGPGPRLIKKNLPGPGLTNVEKHWCTGWGRAGIQGYNAVHGFWPMEIPNGRLTSETRSDSHIWSSVFSPPTSVRLTLPHCSYKQINTHPSPLQPHPASPSATSANSSNGQKNVHCTMHAPV
jgi:hypothetical protein